MKKNNSIHIKLSTEQKNLIRARAEQVGLSLSSYVLFVLLNAKPIISQENNN